MEISQPAEELFHLFRQDPQQRHITDVVADGGQAHQHFEVFTRGGQLTP
jgi:hypothetical protein